MARDEMEYQEFAEVAYNGYCKSTNWKSAVTGEKLPAFKDTPEAVKKGWRAAIKAIEEYTFKHYNLNDLV